MPRKRVTLADVARRAGLSTTAASMILNGRPDTRLSEEAHARVHAAAAELGYRPNVAARGLRTAKTLTIGFVSDMVTTTRFAGGLIKGALTAAEEAGHVVLLAETGGEPDREAEAIAALLDRQVDGIVFAAVRARELFVPPLPEGVSAVMLNATASRFPAAVLPDEEPGGRAAVRLLIDAGHSEGIALIGQSDTAERDVFRSASVARRVAGIRGEMADKGLEFAAEESIWLWEPQHGYEAVTELFRRRTDVRALICMNDRLAFGAYQAAGELGLRIPDDLSVVSFDDDEVAAYLRPGLTTIGLPHEAMGRRAVESLLGREPGAEVLVPMPVVERASIGPPRRR
ncbi:LacI family DNA-binding transcriptional regulator [Streptomyces sp. ST2-7A]|uniref:LacI family DNA-binding transcriptional regulator n=1 Tax=Streptomyces sp. ST2-7A TaxID=2907214 RepID=UPI001F395C27|nr:LacI family DNA-binding transcriptional regulator [Streptomyces sp. ST2-7A]MCE7082618.1 LacI family DNA-binding transcriptional regulator [Streptomyces sp. ST2-7A]